MLRRLYSRILLSLLLFLLFYLFDFLLEFCFASFLQYDLTLVASDSLNENETTVVIRVLDKNDLPPVFSQSLYTSEILEEFDVNLPLKLNQVTKCCMFVDNSFLFLHAVKCEFGWI